MTQAAPYPDIAAEDALAKRMTRRIMPIVIMIYFVAILDKSNIGFAKLQMIGDLKMTEAMFGLGASLFFVGMLLAEVPSSLMAFRFGVRPWITRIMLTWSVATLLLAFVGSPHALYLLRFLLGLTEAGLYPALLFYLSLWFPTRHLARATGLFTLGSAFGNGVGALASGPLLDLNGVAGLAGWQWLFIVTGILPLFAAVVVWRFLPSRISDARFLNDEEKALLTAAVARDRPAQPPKPVWTVFWSLRVLAFSAAFIVILTALFGVIYWTPTVVRQFASTGSLNGVLSAAPWLIVGLSLLIIPPRLKTPRSILFAMAAIGLTGATLFLLSMHFEQPVVRYVCLALGTPCISLSIACFWTWPGRYFSGLHAAAAIAAISTYGNLGGFFAQNLMPWAAGVGGGPAGALAVPAVCLALVGVTALGIALRPAAPLTPETSLV
jgi:MFS family permease